MIWYSLPSILTSVPPYLGIRTTSPTLTLKAIILPLSSIFPVPSAITPLTFSIDRILTAVSSAGTTLNFPPGYAKAFKYALAVELAPLFGKNIANYPGVIKIAQDSFADIKRANQTLPSMRVSRNFSDAGTQGYGDWRSWP